MKSLESIISSTSSKQQEASRRVEQLKNSCEKFWNSSFLSANCLDLLLSYPLAGNDFPEGEVSLVNVPELGSLFLWGVATPLTSEVTITQVDLESCYRLEFEQKGWKDFSFSISDVNPGLPFRWRWNGAAKIDVVTMQLFGIFVKSKCCDGEAVIKLTMHTTFKRNFCFGLISKNIKTVAEVDLRLRLAESSHGPMAKLSGSKTSTPLLLIRDLGMDSGYYREATTRQQLQQLPLSIIP